MTESHILQPFVWPDINITSERDLYVRLDQKSAISFTESHIHFLQGALVRLDTYFNLFNLGKWITHCDLNELSLRLEGMGKIEVVVFVVRQGQSWLRLVNEVITLESDQPTYLNVPIKDQTCDMSVAYVEFRALEDGVFKGGAWETPQPPKRIPSLVLSVTTFKREAAALKTAERFLDFMRTSRVRDNLHMVIVDNGKSADIPDSKDITVIPNENLGGAGGFARGLMAAQSRGASHCLFMDDDASTPMDAFERTWSFLAYASAPETAVAGALIINAHAWAIWENGAIFDRGCKPMYNGTDLRDRDQVFEMEFSSTPRNPQNFYGGWWYFAFPIENVEHFPFPFFVRGDDISFSLVHDFNIVTLSGVVSVQDSFLEKDSPLTWYLDFRSHLAHHLSLPVMEVGRVKLMRLIASYWMRSLICAHYETFSAVNQAFEDVLEGPEFFADNADMSERRQSIGALRKAEAWKKGRGPTPGRPRFNPHNRFHRAVLRLTLNGHLLPFFRSYGNHIALSVNERWEIRKVWGASQITYRNVKTGEFYTVQHSKRAAFRESLRMAKLCLRFWREYESLKRIWQKAYPEMTTESFWHTKLDVHPSHKD